jgi:SAM-dependent methyltransferase
MEVRYDHAWDQAHGLATAAGASAALSTIWSSDVPGSLLDVGCGSGTWLRAAIDLGVGDVLGIDGVDLAQELLRVERKRVQKFDLAKPFDLGRRFDIALCLEVAEHLPESSSNDLISSIIDHSNVILFSAGCPGQSGQHHINCQWPIYWQSLFNKHGFTCDDSIRWRLWDDSRIEPWYRQNIFLARRDIQNAGLEPRLKAVIHPEMIPAIVIEYKSGIENEYRHDVELGRMPISWYLTTPPRAAISKLLRRISRHQDRRGAN